LVAPLKQLRRKNVAYFLSPQQKQAFTFMLHHQLYPASSF